MPDRTQDLKNHRQVAVACKNYTDKEIKASEERILSIVARNNVDFIDHTDEATYRFTAPLNSKLLMLQSIAGNSNKIAPSTPSDDSVARIKTIPENTYKSQVDYIGGKTVKYNQLFSPKSLMTRTSKGLTIVQNGYKCVINGTFTGTTQDEVDAIGDASSSVISVIKDHMYLSVAPTLPSGISGSNVQVGNSTTFGYKKSNGSTITKCLASGNTYSYGRLSNLANGTTFNNYEMYYNLIDLTDKFGAGNEPSTVETAIPLLKANGYKLDGTDTYSVGDFKHAITTSVKYLPINVWDEANLENVSGFSKVNGYWVATGTNWNTVNFKNYINFIKDTKYTFSFEYIADSGLNNPQLIINYDDGTEQTTYFSNLVGDRKVVISSKTGITNARITYGNGGNNNLRIKDLCINISNANYNGNYYPYVAPITKAIPSEVLADNRYGLGFDNTNYNHLDIDGHLRGSWGIVDLGTLNWEFETNHFFADLSTAKLKGYSLCSDKLIAITYDQRNYSVDNTIWLHSPNNQLFATYTSANGDATAFKTAMSGVYLVYELATSFDQDYSQYFTTNWNKVDLNNQYATCEMVVAEPIDMPNKVEYYGTIIHSLATAVKQDGFNAWDEEWEVGGINWQTGATNSAACIRSKNYIPVIPNTQYYFNHPHIDVESGANYWNLAWYDKDYNYISGESSKNLYLKTTPDNTCYVKFSSSTNYGTTYNNDICINISNQDLNGTYKPHKATITRLLPNSEAKYSWGITDGVRNTRVFCDDEGNAVNEGSLDVNSVDLGSLTYIRNPKGNAPSEYRFISNETTASLGIKASTINALSSIYDIGNVNEQGTNMVMALGAYVNLVNMIYDNTTTFKTAMNGVMLEYEKATTDTETLDDFDYFFDCEEGDTFTIIGCELLQCYATYSFLIKEAKSNE